MLAREPTGTSSLVPSHFRCIWARRMPGGGRRCGRRPSRQFRQSATPMIAAYLAVFNGSQWHRRRRCLAPSRGIFSPAFCGSYYKHCRHHPASSLADFKFGHIIFHIRSFSGSEPPVGYVISALAGLQGGHKFRHIIVLSVGKHGECFIPV